MHPTYSTSAADHRAAKLSWRPSPAGIASASHGQQLHTEECATCHASSGGTRTQWRTSVRRRPTNLHDGPHVYINPTTTPIQLAQIIKFGIPSTDMAGHEYLSDADVASLTLYL